MLGYLQLFDDGPVQGAPPLGHAPILVIPDKSEAGDQLHQLGREHRRGGDEHVAGPGPRVPPTQPKHRELHGQSDQAQARVTTAVVPGISTSHD